MLYPLSKQGRSKGYGILSKWALVVTGSRILAKHGMHRSWSAGAAGLVPNMNLYFLLSYFNHSKIAAYSR
jgi:hypothetical protein